MGSCPALRDGWIILWGWNHHGFPLHVSVKHLRSMFGPVLSTPTGKTKRKQESHNPCSHRPYRPAGKTDSLTNKDAEMECGNLERIQKTIREYEQGLSDIAGRQRGSPFEILCHARIEEWSGGGEVEKNGHCTQERRCRDKKIWFLSSWWYQCSGWRVEKIPFQNHAAQDAPLTSTEKKLPPPPRPISRTAGMCSGHRNWATSPTNFEAWPYWQPSV